MNQEQPSASDLPPLAAEPLAEPLAEPPAEPPAATPGEAPAEPADTLASPFVAAAGESGEAPTPPPNGEDAAPTALPPPAPSTALTAEDMPLIQVIEALLFSSDVPLSAGKLAETCGLDSTKPIKDALDQLNASYAERLAAYRIEERAGGFLLLTLPQYADYIERLVRKKDEGRLTPASLETLAIVAYRQPIIRVDIEAIRGVACGEVLRTLMELNLIKIVGRAEIVGRPMLYGTTRYFLEVFGLANLKDLPKAEQLQEPK